MPRVRFDFNYPFKRRDMTQKVDGTIAMEKAAVEDPSIIHSDDGVYSIRLGVAITDPKEKDEGAYVAVHKATLIEFGKKTPPPLKDQHEKNIEDLSDKLDACKLRRCCVGDMTIKAAALNHLSRQPSPEVRGASKAKDEVFTPGKKGGDRNIIVKIFTVEYGSRQRGEFEVAALKRLTASGCKHAPTYLGDFEKKLDHVPGGVVRYVLMTKLPGYALADQNWWYSTSARRNRVEKAFGVAIRAVHTCRVDNRSPFLRNIMWSPANNKCYIVDFERAELTLSLAEMPEVWSDFEWWADHKGQVE